MFLFLLFCSTLEYFGAKRVIFLGIWNQSEFFASKLMGILFFILNLEFLPYEQFSSNELR